MFAFQSRIESAARAMAAGGFDALLFGPGADLRYLTGYDAPLLERLTLFVLTSEDEAVLILPELERPRAEAQGVTVPIRAWGETEDPFVTVAGAVGARPRSVGVSDRLWATFLIRLQATFPDAEFALASRIMSALRLRKDEDEIAALRSAARIADGVAGLLAEEALSGMSERTVARWISDRLLAGGCERVSFAIVAAGENAASPHHEPTGRPIVNGDVLVCDFGGTVDGYGSDITRTFAVGTVREDIAEIHEIVGQAQDAAYAAAGPGRTAASVDAAARKVITGKGYGSNFTHRTGHGIGLEEHEDPYIVAGNETVLEEGMAFSIEPGIYLPGRLGVRIEDIVVVGSDGAERLNRAPRNLVVLRL